MPHTFLRVCDNFPGLEDERPVVLRVARAGGLPERFPWKTGIETGGGGG